MPLGKFEFSKGDNKKIGKLKKTVDLHSARENLKRLS